MAIPGRQPGAKGTSTTLVGAILIVFAAVATILSYSANRGLPFVPTYDIQVAVPDAAELIAGSSEVRIGGARAGIVKEIRAVPPAPGRRAYALLSLGLAKGEEGLPVDTRADVRPRSILGAKFVELTRGRSRKTVPVDGTLPLSQADSGVGIDEAFKVFEPRTRKVLQQTVINLGDGVAGRGSAFSETITSLNGLVGPLQRTLRTLSAPGTRLGGAIVAADRATAVLAPVAPQLADVLDDGATTLAALDAARPALDRAIADTPPTLRAARAAGLSSRPVLDDTTEVLRGLRPAVEELPAASRALGGALTTGTPILGRVPGLARRLDGTLTVLDRVARQPTSQGAVQRLTDAVRSADTGLDVIGPAQLTCNTLALFFRNIADVVSEGDAAGSWFDTILLIDPERTGRQTRQADDLHSNPVPVNDATQCETGNEPFEPGRRVGSPGGAQAARTEDTSAPAEATQRARAAGVIEGDE